MTHGHYTVAVRDHLMIAHSFRGALFGPAQALHGATFVVDLELRARELDQAGVVVDIGRAGAALSEVLGALNYKNLDEVPDFAGTNTTTEVVAKHIFDEMAGRAAAGSFGAGSENVEWIRVTLHESHVAWAAFEGPVPRPG